MVHLAKYVYSGVIFANEIFIDCGAEVIVTFNKSTSMSEGDVKILFLHSRSRTLFETEDDPSADIPIGLFMDFDSRGVDDINIIRRVGGEDAEAKALKMNKRSFQSSNYFVISFLIDEDDFIISINGIAGKRIPHSKAWRKMGMIHFYASNRLIEPKSAKFSHAQLHTCKRLIYSLRKDNNNLMTASFISNRH